MTAPTPKVVVLKPMVGICHMQACVDVAATDEEILAMCNQLNLSGTQNGWAQVHRAAENGFFKTPAPVPCADNPQGRVHLLVSC